jgi:hypothetical protein
MRGITRKIEQRLCDLPHTPKHFTTAMLLQPKVEGIVRPLTNKYPELNKWLVLIGTVLLIGLVLTPFAWHTTLGNHEVAGAMGRGGQFEKALLW